MRPDNNRREFLKYSALAGVGFWAAGGLTVAASKAANEQINIACVGVGGKGQSDTEQAGQVGNIVALCDVDDRTLEAMSAKFPKAKKFHDFRTMLDEMGNQIDAVTVSTPDHMHAPASLMAMRLKKHVYCQKPLTHTVYEARLMRETAQKMGVATQMGNQGTASDGLRRSVELIQEGAIGPVKEVHVWTNRPIWPQGGDAIINTKAGRAAALAALHGKVLSTLPRPEVPPYLHWDQWLGVAPDRPYDTGYHPFSWRGWWDFGTGALGDMACHTANLAFMALKLQYPTSVAAVSGEINPETYPTYAEIVYEFPARGDLPPVKLYWYEGQKNGEKRMPPERLTKGLDLRVSGALLVGEKGMLFQRDDYGARCSIVRGKDIQPVEGGPQELPRNGKDDLGMKEEWAAAIRGGPPAISNFGYAALLTETILLGNVAMRAGKETGHGRKRIEWDGEQMRATNAPEAEQFLKPEYRKGYTL